MSIETYLIVPTGSRARAEELLRDRPELEDEAQLGEDFVALYQSEPFSRIQRDPELWGATYLELIPAPFRVNLDKRGLLVVPEIGQSFADLSYEEVAGEKGATWLPIGKTTSRRLAKRVLLVHLSANRQERLVRAPALVREIVAARLDQPIPQALELGEAWVELQKLLHDWQAASGKVDARSDALTPRKGLPLYEDKTIDSAFLVRAPEARATAEWVLGLPPDVLGRGRKKAKALEAALARLKEFYRLVLAQECAVLAIRFTA